MPDTAYVVIAKTDELSRPEWLEERRKGIGSSDAAAVAGLSTWSSPYSVYADKTGEFSDDETSEAAEWGMKLEPLILEEFAFRTGIAVERRPVMIASVEHPWMLANIDGWAVADGLDIGLVEAKTVGARQAYKWEGDAVPDEYLIQVLHQLAVTGLRRAWVVVLVAGQELRIFDINLDGSELDAALTSLVEIEAAFWQRVTDRIPPPADGHRATTEAVKEMFADSVPGAKAELPVHALDLLEMRKAAKTSVATAERDLDAIDNQIKALLGESEIGTVDGQTVVTWKSTSSTRLDTKAHKEAHPECVAQFSTTSTSRRFLVPGS